VEKYMLGILAFLMMKHQANSVLIANSDWDFSLAQRQDYCMNSNIYFAPQHSDGNDLKNTLT
jgi:hypothetical protein